MLMANRVALWDVLKACKRKGSLDSSIINDTIIANNFEVFYAEHPQIKFVFFNGAKAEQAYKKHISETVLQHNSLTYYRLPSTSPAMASLTKDEKLTQWKIIREVQ